MHTEEPRSTLDIGLAVPTYADIPRRALLAAGFEHTGRHEHSDNWRAPGAAPLKQRTAVQFSAEGDGSLTPWQTPGWWTLPTASGCAWGVSTSAELDARVKAVRVQLMS